MNSVFWTAIIVCPLTPMIKKKPKCVFWKKWSITTILLLLLLLKYKPKGSYWPPCVVYNNVCGHQILWQVQSDKKVSYLIEASLEEKLLFCEWLKMFLEILLWHLERRLWPKLFVWNQKIKPGKHLLRSSALLCLWLNSYIHDPQSKYCAFI